MKSINSIFVLLMFACTIGCTGDSNQTSEQTPSSSAQTGSGAAEEQVSTASVTIQTGPNAQTEAQEALILAEPGDIIEFAEGKFEFDGTLTIDGVKDVTLRGKGLEKTILNFAKFKQGKGGEGLKVKADNFVIEDLTIEDTPGDAIKLQDCNGLTMRRLKTWWTGGPSSENGAYGLYPVLSNNVLIEDCVAECASDAGIYVGQSKQVVVRNCRAEKNVAGIEIENCIGADVYDNVANDNTGGILVFSLPGLTIKNGSDCRIYDNEMSNNNHPNFAKEGAMVATVPPGTGLMIMANDRVEVFGNTIDGHISAGCLIVSFLTAQRKFDDAEYDPFPESISIHDNRFSGGGTDPHGEFLEMYAQATGQRIPDIVFDGFVDTAKFVDGKLPDGLGLAITNNEDATFVNLDLATAFQGKEPNMSHDLSPHANPLPAVPAVELTGTN